MNNTSGSQVFRDMVHQLVAASRVNEPVLLVGGVGTGKRQSAASIHKASARSAARFVTVNCLGHTESKFEMELFGAVSSNFELNRKGAVAMADGGTLYLHEISELSTKSQSLLVRFLETGTYCPINGHDLIRSDVRVICSSSVPLEPHVQTGLFRNDLYHLITPIFIHTPNLNDRLEDIPMLVGSLLRDMGYAGKRVFSESALIPLMQHSFNGNLIELRNIIFRLVHNFKDKDVTEDQVRFCLRGDVRFETSFNEALMPAQLRADHWGLGDNVQLTSQVVDTAGLPPAESDSSGQGDGSVASALRPAKQGDKSTLFEKATDVALGEYADLNKPTKISELGDTESTDEEAKLAPRPERPAHKKAATGAQPLSLKEQEREYLRQLLDHCKGDKRQAAEIAGLTLRTFYRKLELLDGGDE